RRPDDARPPTGGAPIEHPPMGRAQPPPTSRIVPQFGVPLVPEPPSPPKRSVGRILGTVATTLLVLAVLGVVFKIIVRPVPTTVPDAPTAAASDGGGGANGAPIPAPNGGSAPGPVVTGSAAPVQASGVPMPRGDLPGWHQTFADDFTGNLGDK